MANLNPIKTKDDGKYPDFFLDKNNQDKTLFILTKTELDKSGWLLDLIHTLSLKGKPISFDVDSNGDIKKQKIGIVSEIVDKKFSLVSVAGRIRNGGSGDPALVNYKIEFLYEDDIIFDSFSLTSSKSNPTTFYTKITFKFEL